MNDDATRSVLLVVGSRLAAEREHRPLAYELCGRVQAAGGAGALDAVVCSDLWYLNHPGLQSRPVISVGPPGDNALSARLVDRLPVATAIEGVFAVQLDLDFVDLKACLWGVDVDSTRLAVDAFAERYLDDFVRQSRAA